MTIKQACRILRHDMIRFMFMSILLIGFGGCSFNGPGPGPKPEPDIDSESSFEKTARESFLNQAEAYSKVFQDISGKLTDGEITTENELHKELKTLLTKARKDSFYPIDQAIVDELNGDAFSTSKASRVMNGISKGFDTFTQRNRKQRNRKGTDNHE